MPGLWGTLAQDQGMLTWPIQDDQMNMAENFEHDQKIHTEEH